MRRGNLMREGSLTAAGVAAVVVFGLLLLAPLLVPILYLFFTIVGMAHGTALGASTIDSPLVLTGVAVATAALLVALYAGVAVLGRSFTPRKRRD